MRLSVLKLPFLTQQLRHISTMETTKNHWKTYIRVGGESYYIKQKVITYAGVPHMGCNEMWVCPAFWPHFTEKVKQYIEKIQQTPKGAGAKRRPPWGAAEGSAFVVFCSMYCLTFFVKCGQNVGHTHISWHLM